MQYLPMHMPVHMLLICNETESLLSRYALLNEPCIVLSYYMGCKGILVHIDISHIC